MIFWGYFSYLCDVCKYIDTKHQHQTRLNNEVIDYYKINYFIHQSSFLS